MNVRVNLVPLPIKHLTFESMEGPCARIETADFAGSGH